MTSAKADPPLAESNPPSEFVRLPRLDKGFSKDRGYPRLAMTDN